MVYEFCIRINFGGLSRFKRKIFTYRSGASTDYGLPERKLPSLNGRKSTPTPKYLGTAEAYFV